MESGEKSSEKLVSSDDDILQQSAGNKILESIKNIFTWQLMKPILCGQVLSVLICGTSITSEYLNKNGINTPVFQNLPNYILFALVYTSTLFLKRTEQGERLLFKILRESWWKFLIIAVIDVEANYMIVKAYQYTSLTSVQLLDCFVIVVVMMLSCYFLKIRYGIVHYIGLVVSLVGVVCMVVADIDPNSDAQAPNPALGDVLVLGAACCYGMSNVAMEYVTKKEKNGFLHILGMLGFFCPVISGIQTAILEHDSIASIEFSWKIFGLFAGYTCCMFILYTCMPLVMLLSSATAVNISILTADLFALIVGHYLFQYSFSPLYLVSLATIVVALIIYNSRQPIQLQAEEEETSVQEGDTAQQNTDDNNLNQVSSSI